MATPKFNFTEKTLDAWAQEILSSWQSDPATIPPEGEAWAQDRGGPNSIPGLHLRIRLRKEHGAFSPQEPSIRFYLLKKVDGVAIPQKAAYAKHVYHIYAIRVKNRDVLIAALAAKDIHCGIHYPIPLHLQEAYKSLGYKNGAFPVAEKAAAEFVSLPMYPELTGEQIAQVATELKGIVLAPVN